MEQKTEASQAVDELLPCPFCGFPASLKSVNDWHSVEVDHDGNCPLAWSGASLRAKSVDAKWITSVWNSRAALKAQPAPAEAAQGMTNAERVQAMNPFKFVPWSKEAEMIEGWTKAEKERNEAQGEDSARLDAYLLPSMSSLCGCKACNQIMTRRMMFICGKCGDKNCPSATNHLNKCMGRARASAETGGVK